MDFATYYKQFVADCELMGADEFCEYGNDDGFHVVNDQQLIALAVNGAGVGAVGHELARRGLLNKVPGEDWGTPGNL